MMQSYAEGYELLAAVDLIEDVTGVIASWTRGTVIRSWLLDLLVRALLRGPAARADHRLRRGLRRGRVDRRAGPSRTPSRCPRSPRRCSPGSSPARTTRPTMKAVAALRQPVRRARGARRPDAGGREAPERGPPCPPPRKDPRKDLAAPHPHARGRGPAGGPFQYLTPGRLTCTSATCRSAPSAAGSGWTWLGPGPDGVRRAQRRGQDQPGRGRRLPRDHEQPPGLLGRAAGAPRGRPGGRAGGAAPRRPGAAGRDRDQPGAGQPGAGQPRSVAAAARTARPGAHGALRARGPRPDPWRPHGAAALPRRTAGHPHAAAGRRACGLRPGAQAAQRPAEVRPAGPREGDRDPRRLGRPPHRRRGAAAGRTAAADRRSRSAHGELLRGRGRRGRRRRRARVLLDGAAGR